MLQLLAEAHADFERVRHLVVMVLLTVLETVLNTLSPALSQADESGEVRVGVGFRDGRTAYDGCGIKFLGKGSSIDLKSCAKISIQYL
jgi:hypothetical protein